MVNQKAHNARKSHSLIAEQRMAPRRELGCLCADGTLVPAEFPRLCLLLQEEEQELMAARGGSGR
mgnify:CR=1 FL=1